MIYSVTGKLKVLDDNSVVVDGGAVSFLCICSTNAVFKLRENAEAQITLLTYLHVREDEMTLFGFIDNNEKEIFLKLITVSGIGPKMAISILSNITVPNLVDAIISGNIKVLSSIKGLGKKTAERMCLELKDKINPLDGFGSVTTSINTGLANPATSDACEVLLSLGLNKTEALSLANAYAKDGMTAEQIVAVCLKNMGR